MTTQSFIHFPSKRVEDWYTRGDKIGSGAYGEVYRALDDRERLFRFKYNMKPTDIIEGFFPQELYKLHSENPSSEVIDQNVKTWQDLVHYLSFFNYRKIYKLYLNMFEFSFDADSDSRYELIMSFVNKWKRQKRHEQDNDIDEEDVVVHFGGNRVNVAVKTLGKLTMPPLTNQQSLEASTKTEVFGLGMVASETPIYFNETATNLRLEKPVECQILFGTPMISCLRDYFVTSKKEAKSYTVVQSLTDGPDLHDLMTNYSPRIFNRNAPMPDAFVWFVAWHMAHALNHSHIHHIIHNDVKLENVVYDKKTGGLSLIDYGLSCHVKMDSCDSTGGTIYYTPKEVFAPIPRRYPVSDVWALGILLWELASGRLYTLPDQTVDNIVKSIVAGTKPILNPINPDMWKRQEFIELLTHIFEVDYQKRATTTQVVQYIHHVFFPEISASRKKFDQESDYQVGEYLHGRSKNAIDKLLESQNQNLWEKLVTTINTKQAEDENKSETDDEGEGEDNNRKRRPTENWEFLSNEYVFKKKK